MKHIMKPRRRLSGSFLIGLVLFALILGSNMFALADSPDTIQALVFDQALEGAVMDSVFIKNWGDHSESRDVYGWDEDALTEYLASLRLRQAYTTDTYTSLTDQAARPDHRLPIGNRQQMESLFPV